jgi:hypothetical protein
MENLGNGNGEQKVFWTGESPVAPASEVIYLYNSVSASMALVANTAYTLDDETGRVVFVTAPLPYEVVYASYDVYESSSWYTTWGSDDFVVLSADQSAWYGLEQKYSNMDNWFGGFNSTEARSLAMEADYNDSLAWDSYYAGNFATARSFQQIAVDKLQAAIDAEVAYNKGWEDREISSDNADLSQQLAYVSQIQSQSALNNAETASLNAQTARTNALLDAEKAKLKGEATKAKSYGTFLILMGVFAILVGVAVLVLAVSRLMTARTPHTHSN